MGVWRSLSESEAKSSVVLLNHKQKSILYPPERAKLIGANGLRASPKHECDYARSFPVYPFIHLSSDAFDRHWDWWCADWCDYLLHSNSFPSTRQKATSLLLRYPSWKVGRPENIHNAVPRSSKHWSVPWKVTAESLNTEEEELT